MAINFSFCFQVEGDVDEFDVEKTTFEVLKFAIDNDVQRERRLNAKQQLLIKLGAKVDFKKPNNAV